MGESRQELLAWLNDLLQLNITKVEQIGTGAALCQIFDSIYLDVNLKKVKWQAKQEWEYLHNFSVLQETFKRHRIPKPIEVQSLVKCKMQDNLEFLQWVKKYWDSNFPGEEYDPIARRGGATIDNNPLISGVAKSRGGVAPSKMSAGSATSRTGPGVRGATTASAPTARRTAAGSGIGSGARPAAANASVNRAVQELTAQMDEMKINVEGLEKERDFYFGKLRQIEILITARLEQENVIEDEAVCLKEMQEILYSTEEGFEVPQEEEEALQDEEETF